MLFSVGVAGEDKLSSVALTLPSGALMILSPSTATFLAMQLLAAAEEAVLRRAGK